MRIPIILSIATFRHWDKETKIYVIDISDVETNWEDYPKFLNFHVIKKDYYLKPYEKQIDTSVCVTRFLSKPHDVYTFTQNIVEDSILCVDIDYFFVQKPVFEYKHNAAINIGDNTGYWRYHKKSPLTKPGFETWIKYCYEGCFNERLRNDMMLFRQNIGVFQDEVAMYTVSREHPKYYEAPPWKYNVLFNKMGPDIDGSKIHGLHIISQSFYIAWGERGLICLYVRELKDIVTKVLGKERMDKIFQARDLPCYSIKNMKKMAYLHWGYDVSLMKS